MDCTEFHEMLDDYLEEQLDEARRNGFRSHLRACSSCSEWARSKEPTLLFTVAESAPVDLTRIEACAVAVTGQIRQERLARRLRSSRRPWLAVAAAVVVGVVGAAAWQLMPFEGKAPSVLSSDAAPAAATGTAPPTVEVEMPGDNVRVYQFANEQDDDTAVYYIVNPALEL